MAELVNNVLRKLHLVLKRLIIADCVSLNILPSIILRAVNKIAIT